MLLRASNYYLGVWIPTAVCWVIVVLVAALFADVAVGTGLGWAVAGSFVSILFGAAVVREDKKSSIGFIRSHPNIEGSELLRRGLKKGWIIGLASVSWVGFMIALPFLLDRILTALGK